MTKGNALGGAVHTAGIYSDLTVDGPEIGTLVVIVERARNLPNRKFVGKQDPYCAARLGKEAKKTETDRRGGQTPKWDQELRFVVRDSPDYYQMKISVFNDNKKTELIGETWVNLQEVVVPGGGYNDAWHSLNCKSKYAGEIRMKITYYDSRPKQEKVSEKVRQTSASGAPDGHRESMAEPRQPKLAQKRRPLPFDPTGASPSPSMPDHQPSDLWIDRSQDRRHAESMPDHQPSDLWIDRSQDRRHAEKAHVMEKILDEIHSATKCREKPAKSFICYEDLKRIWSDKSRISTLLQPDCLSQDQIHFIQECMIMILSTLISVGAAECLTNFRARLIDSNSGNALVTDDGIPFEMNQLFFLDSEPALQVLFYQYQFRFKPVVIQVTKGQTTQVIKNQMLRLPFEYREKNIGCGAYGSVDLVGISPKYIREEAGSIWETVYEVACKKIKVPEDFDREVNNLQILKESLTRHHGIMLHLATIEHGPNRYILLPYARYGDLEVFLHCGIGSHGERKYDFDKQFNEVRNSDVTLPLLHQCSSLASALAWLHTGITIENSSSTIFCVHMNLKPANILIQHDPNSVVGKWMISDFTISVLKEEPKRQVSEFVSIGDYYSQLAVGVQPTRFPGTYQAPEVEVSLNVVRQLSHLTLDQKGIGRKSDIWSYGCIFSEVLAFALGKDKFVLQFQNARKYGRNDYFYIEKEDQGYLTAPDNMPKQYQVRPSVISWLEGLRGKTASPQRWVDCYIEAIKNILIVDTVNRPDATRLANLVDHVKKHVATSLDRHPIHCYLLENLPAPPKDSGYSSMDSSQKEHGFTNIAEGIQVSETDDSDLESTAPSSSRHADLAISTKPSSLSSEAAMVIEQVRESRSSMTFINYKNKVMEHNPDKRDDDIQSLKSIPDDIDSLAESNSGIANYRQAAVNYTVKAFTDDSELLALYQEAALRMKKEKFVRNHRILLKTFFLDLCSEGHTPSQKLAVRFLRSRSRRIHISSEIHSLVMPSENTVQEKINFMVKQEKDNFFLLSRFLDERDSASQPASADTAGLPVTDNKDTTSGDSDDDDDTSSDASEAEIEKLEATAGFLTSGRPFSLYKENLRGFLHSPPEAADLQVNLQLDIAQARSVIPEQSFMDVWKTELGDIIPATPKADEKQKREQPFCNKRTSQLGYLFQWVSWLKKFIRPKVKPGYRRIEWQCDCGVDLFADFPNSDGTYLDNLAFSLQNPGQPSVTQASDIPLSSSDTPAAGFSCTDAQGGLSMIGTSTRDSVKQVIETASSANAPQAGDTRPRYLALCVNTGGIYKTLAEINTTSITSDARLFLGMKEEYLKKRGLRSRFRFLIKPTTVEFVQFTLWNLRGGYVSICKRPDCIPPHDSDKYEYLPKPLEPPPPMPPEIFIHYLEHGEEDLNPKRNDWLPRLPKRMDKRVIDYHEGCYGWGVHVIEGPNREVIFWIVMVTILASVLISALWSTLRSDVQGGTGLGALIVALPPAILAAFLFRLGV